MAAVRDGDDAAFEELYRRYYPRIAAFVRGYLRDGGRAEDVTQEAFMSALRRLRQTDTAIAFKPWIFEIARNASIDQYRRNTRADEVSIDIEGGFAPAEVARLVRPREPESSMLDKQRLDHLTGALDELSETHHRIIVMRELEGLSYREIGERMELTPAAVESTLFRARRKLEHEYSQLDTGRRCQLIGAVIARLAEGLDSERDRKRLHRHARRCSTCRRRSRELGVEPMLPRHGIAARAAALLPLPAFFRRRISGDGSAATMGAHNAAAPVGVVGTPTLELGVAVAGKAAAVVAAVALAGGGGAALDGAGPLDLGGKGATVEQYKQQRSAPAPSRSGERSETSRGSFHRKTEAGSGTKGTAEEKRFQQVGEGAATKKPAAPPKPARRGPSGALPALTPGLLGVPREDPGGYESPPEDQSPSPRLDLPRAEPESPAPPAAAVVTAAPQAVAGALGLQ